MSFFFCLKHFFFYLFRICSNENTLSVVNYTLIVAMYTQSCVPRVYMIVHDSWLYRFRCLRIWKEARKKYGNRRNVRDFEMRKFLYRERLHSDDRNGDAYERVKRANSIEFSSDATVQDAGRLFISYVFMRCKTRWSPHTSKRNDKRHSTSKTKKKKNSNLNFAFVTSIVFFFSASCCRIVCGTTIKLILANIQKLKAKERKKKKATRITKAYRFGTGIRWRRNIISSHAAKMQERIEIGKK